MNLKGITAKKKGNDWIVLQVMRGLYLASTIRDMYMYYCMAKRKQIERLEEITNSIESGIPIPDRPLENQIELDALHAEEILYFDLIPFDDFCRSS
jgi:hypothetical protein